MIAAVRHTKSVIIAPRYYKSKYLAATHLKSGILRVTTFKNRFKNKRRSAQDIPKAISG